MRLLFVTERDGPPLVGVAVGRKIACAAQRVRGRRIMREAFRRLLPWIKDGTWIVASLREKGLDTKADEIYMDIAASLKRRGLLSPHWPGADWEIDGKRS